MVVERGRRKRKRKRRRRKYNGVAYGATTFNQRLPTL
jgi:hypothetical protein